LCMFIFAPGPSIGPVNIHLQPEGNWTSRVPI
jgi:hypothetical protein